MNILLLVFVCLSRTKKSRTYCVATRKKRVGAQLQVHSGLAIGTKKVVPTLRVEDGLPTGTKKSRAPVASGGWDCNLDKKRSGSSCELIVDLQLKKKVGPQLRVKGELATGTKKDQGPVASQWWTCNWDKKRSCSTCEFLMDLQLVQKC